MKSFEKLLNNNKEWATRKTQQQPEYFNALSEIQKPEFMWIGCSDSRVPANEITGTQPGEIFVHRNIANLVIHTDVNLLSVLDYAVTYLEVKHVIVCGHYGCGGVGAALTNKNYNQVLNMWLRNIKDVYRLHSNELDSINDEKEKCNRLVELNVREQLIHLAKTSIIQKAWAHHQRPHLHGWVYGLDNGLIKPVFDMPPQTKIDSLYVYEDL